MKKAVFIGLVWPEPTSTAAGGRIMRLIQLFMENGFTVSFMCAAAKSDRSADLKEIGCKTIEIKLNDSSFDSIIKEENPDLVVFDRFLSEEQFGWRVHQEVPNAVKILDSEDLHFLRKARHQALKKSEKVNLQNDLTKREVAAVYRCDLTLIISEFEMKLLTSEFNIPSYLLHYLPFNQDRLNKDEIDKLPVFEERVSFMTIGNFKHEPNYDSVRYLKAEVWPLIREKMPNAEMNVYGAYLNENALEWNKPKNGFNVIGVVKNADEVFMRSKVCLSPLRFGAGLKGKFIGAMKNGTPIITTAIGAEGMKDKENWPGSICESPEEIANAAISLYLNKERWLKAQATGFTLINNKFATPIYEDDLLKVVGDLLINLEDHRRSNFIGEMLQFHTLRSTEFMSRWIETKNKYNSN